MAKVKVKICGITSVEDALCAKKAGADYIGLVFYHKSPRRVSLSKAALIRKEVGKRVKVVGVFVNRDKQVIDKIKKDVGLDLIQLHGDEDLDCCYQFSAKEIIKAIRIKDNSRILDKYINSDLKNILLDKYSSVAYGGAGKPFDWELAKDFVEKFSGKVFLSGGLNVENVASAISKVKPFAVDVSTGVEIKPGIKDHKKVREFIRKAKGC